MEKISQSVGDILPSNLQWLSGPLIALGVIIIGYFISKIAQAVISSAINRTGIGRKVKTTGGNIGKSLSKAVFWVLWLIFILTGLGEFPLLSNQLSFLNGMMDNILNYLQPNSIRLFQYSQRCHHEYNLRKYTFSFPKLMDENIMVDIMTKVFIQLIPFIFVGGQSFHIKNVHPKNIQYNTKKNWVGRSQ